MGKRSRGSLMRETEKVIETEETLKTNNNLIMTHYSVKCILNGVADFRP